MNMEEWREIDDSNGWMISSYGNIKNPKGEIVSPKRTMGYTRLSFNGKREYVHRLVAKTFIPNPLNKPNVDHKNGVRDDNRVSNLQWVTERENSMLAAKMGCFKGIGKTHTIVAVNAKTKEEKYFQSQVEAAKYFGIGDSEVNKALRGERATSHGWKFYYLDDYRENIDMVAYSRWIYGTDGKQLSLFDL